MQRIQKNDLVEVISGKDRGRQGRVLQVFVKESRAIVEGVAVAKRHQKASQEGGPAGIVEKNLKLHLSNLMPVDSKTGKRSRVRVKIDGDQKTRVFVKSGEPVTAANAKAK